MQQISYGIKVQLSLQDLVPFTGLRGNGKKFISTNELQTDCTMVSNYKTDHNAQPGNFESLNFHSTLRIIPLSISMR